MILYNTTFNVDLKVATDFKTFIEDYIFDEIQNKELYQLLNEDNSDGITYCFQLIFNNMGTFNNHIAVVDTKFKNDIVEKFGEQVLFFSSILQKI